MDVQETINEIYELAKNGDIRVYDMLSTKSKEELKNISNEKIVETIQRYFLDKALFVGHSTTNNHEIYFEVINTKEPLVNHRILLVKENEEYKLAWNESLYRENE